MFIYTDVAPIEISNDKIQTLFDLPVVADSLKLPCYRQLFKISFEIYSAVYYI